MLDVRKVIEQEKIALQNIHAAARQIEIERYVPEYLHMFSVHVRQTGTCNFTKACNYSFMRSYVAEAVVEKLAEAGWHALITKACEDNDEQQGYCWTVTVYSDIP